MIVNVKRCKIKKIFGNVTVTKSNQSINKKPAKNHQDGCRLRGHLCQIYSLCVQLSIFCKYHKIMIIIALYIAASSYSSKIIQTSIFDRQTCFLGPWFLKVLIFSIKNTKLFVLKDFRWNLNFKWGGIENR